MAQTVFAAGVANGLQASAGEQRGQGRAGAVLAIDAGTAQARGQLAVHRDLRARLRTEPA
ncbi:hypothetical protein D3C87_1400620 [compost metagenome]